MEVEAEVGVAREMMAGDEKLLMLRKEIEKWVCYTGVAL
jgi:hypothetical protein